MRISTNEFLQGSLNDLLAQQSSVNQLNREIATGEALLRPADDPGAAGQVVGLANQIGQLTYDAANGQAATQTLQNGVGALQQVTNLLVQLRQTAESIANGTSTPSDRQSAIASAQSTLQQLVQLANTQGPNGGYLFAGSKSNARAFSTQPTGQVVFNGDGATNRAQIAPSLDVASTISGTGIFMNVPPGQGGVARSPKGAQA